MPRKEATELAFARLLAQYGSSVELTLVIPQSYQPRHVSADHIEQFYRRWPDIREMSFDGLIITGAPVETLPFEDVSYWSEIRQIFEWAKTNVGSALYVCWAAQAALYALRGVDKHLLAEKAFGVFEQIVTVPASPLARGMGVAFPIPVSRHSAVSEQALAAAGLAPIVRSAATGACIVDDVENRAVYIFDHLEYDDDTLQLEYDRDRNAGKAIAPPHIDRAGSSWRPYAALFFRNWLDRISARKEEPDPTLVWLFQDVAHAGRDKTELLLQAATRPNLLAETLQCLDEAGVNATYANVRQQNARMSLVMLELDEGALSNAEHAAAALTHLPGVRRVLYRLHDGCGGVLRPVPDRADLNWAA